MNRSESLQHLLVVISEIGDVDFQRNSWFGKGPFVSSPDEMLCQYFDDYCGEKVIEEELGALTTDQRNALINFNKQLKLFSDATESHLDPTNTFENPQWDYIRKLAAHVCNQFKIQ